MEAKPDSDIEMVAKTDSDTEIVSIPDSDKTNVNRDFEEMFAMEDASDKKASDANTATATPEKTKGIELCPVTGMHIYRQRCQLCGHGIRKMCDDCAQWICTEKNTIAQNKKLIDVLNLQKTRLYDVINTLRDEMKVSDDWEEEKRIERKINITFEYVKQLIECKIMIMDAEHKLSYLRNNLNNAENSAFFYLGDNEKIKKKTTKRTPIPGASSTMEPQAWTWAISDKKKKNSDAANTLSNESNTSIDQHAGVDSETIDSAANESQFIS